MFRTMKKCQYPLQPRQLHLPGYSELSTLFSGLSRLLPDVKEGEGFDLDWKLQRIGANQTVPGGIDVQIQKGKQTRSTSAYGKVTHILDPTRWMQGYYTHKEKGERRRLEKFQNPNNQAYVDAVACAMLSRVRGMNLSPHFCLTYGIYRGTADVYQWDISQEYETLRRYKHFWNKKRLGLFTLRIDLDDDEDSNASISSRYMAWLTSTPKSECHSRAFSYDSQSTDSRASTPRSHISILERVEDEGGVKGDEFVLEDGLSISTAGSDTMKLQKPSGEEEEPPAVQVLSEMEKFPVIMIFQEEMEGTLEELLMDEVDDADELESEHSDEETVYDVDKTPSASGATEDSQESGTASGSEEDSSEEEETDEEKEARWCAWIFQVVAAVAQLQGMFQFTHNDLHTSNIVWKETEEEFLWYTANDGRIWRVPTYGKVFKIIDFGRSIFTVAGTHFCSDDFAKGGDAEGQYNYGDIFHEARGPRMEPNYSFDLCRLAISLIDAIYPEAPREGESGVLLSKLGEWEQKETVSPLFNLLWKWMVMDDGTPVYRLEDGTERFPNFELYKQIAHNVHGATPTAALKESIFQHFLASDDEQKEAGATVYKLFV
jgi:hypothetical protein